MLIKIDFAYDKSTAETVMHNYTWSASPTRPASKERPGALEPFPHGSGVFILEPNRSRDL
jgi:hypothetical protein